MKLDDNREYIHSHRLRSAASIICHTENEIAWSGLEAVIHNGSVDDLVLFHRALDTIGAKEKSKAILDCIEAIEKHYDGLPPREANGYAIAADCQDSIRAAEKLYDSSSESTDELVLKFTQSNQSEISFLQEEANSSEYAEDCLQRIDPSLVPPQLTGEPVAITIDLNSRLEFDDCGELVKSFEPELGLLVGGGKLDSCEARFSYINERWGAPLKIVFSGSGALKAKSPAMFFELRQWFPYLFDGIRNIRFHYE